MFLTGNSDRSAGVIVTVMEREIRLTVNGRQRTVRTDPERSLLDVLREDLHLTGAKYGCGEGMCRACTVLMDDAPVSSCLTTIDKAAGKKITTIEGLASDDVLHPVQEAFLEVEAIQCGYCVPGQILRAVALIDSISHPSDDDIVRAMNGNLCRCNGYIWLMDAVRRAAEIKAERTMTR